MLSLADCNAKIIGFVPSALLRSTLVRLSRLNVAASISPLHGVCAASAKVLNNTCLFSTGPASLSIIKSTSASATVPLTGCTLHFADII